MDAITAGLMGSALISSAGSVGGSLLSGDMSKKAADKAARWQLYMSNTAHQRAVEDLRKAGLNPLLALHSPASTGQMPMPSIPDLGQALSTGVNSAVAARSAAMSLKSQKIDLDQKKAMFRWLDMNPPLKRLFYGGMLASTAGLPGTIFGPIMAGGASTAKGVLAKIGRWMADTVNVPTYQKHYKDMNERNAALRELFRNQR